MRVSVDRYLVRERLTTTTPSGFLPQIINPMANTLGSYEQCVTWSSGYLASTPLGGVGGVVSLAGAGEPLHPIRASRLTA